LPVKTPISLPFSSRRAKFLISFSAMVFPSESHCTLK
jgi:hypothetical protein